ncbi:MAG: hypothetical protein MIO92_11435 [Methanosarcinaceae archaeon]|nr:hypothetical protein [Methanosarcinaceae archaeon]
MNRNKMVDIDIDGIINSTDLAFLVKIDDEEIWLPKSQIKFETDPKNLDTTTLISVPEWLAEKKGLI